MNMQERLKPMENKLTLIIAFIFLLSLGVVAGQYAQANERGTIFTDIEPGSEYEDALASLVQQKIILGYSDGTYRASEKLNRAQAAIILARALQLNLEMADNPGFQDVNESSTYYKPIAAVVSAGIFQGYSDGTFKPHQLLTRAEMAKILVIAYQFPEEKLAVNPFKDVPSASWYAPYVTSLLQNKITLGTSPTTYSPNEAVNRGDMALFIYRCQLAQQLTERIIESKVTTITSDSVQLGNDSFSLSDDQKAWITPENLSILKNSRIKAHIIGGKISRIESVTIYADGRLHDDKANSNVVLSGNGAVIGATMIIKGDHLSIKDATITGDLIIESEVQNSFYVENVLVKGSTILLKPRELVTSKLYSSIVSLDNKKNDLPNLHFHKSILQSVKVALEGSTVTLTGETKVNEIDLLVDASIEADASIGIPIVRVGTGSLYTVLNARIDSLFIENTNSRITLGNEAKIEDLRLELKNNVKLIFLNYELIKHKIIRINGVLNIDLQPSAGGTPNSGENSNLIAAKNAVASLFRDSTKTALKASVDQAAIDAAKAKVDLVADSAEKSTLLADIQYAQQLLDAQLEAIAKLQAATEAVNGLFTDSTKTALKVDVDQAAIDAAKAKVDQVADGTEKSALLADLQFAQQLLDAQLEAIAKLQAAIEAVNGLFTDSTKTALKAGVDQVSIDAAKAKVDLVADGTEKSALLADIQVAQQLLDAQLEAIAKLQAAIEAVNGLFTDSTKTALKAGVDQAAIDAAKAKADQVADSAEKSALVADLQFAQQLLDAQLEAIAKLQAAIEAVNGLFTDSTKTALKAGVDQVSIDSAKAKVDLVADSAEKSTLLADIQYAQQLLDVQLEAIAKLQAATEAVNGLFTDSTKTALKVGVDQAAIDVASAKVDLVADGTEKSSLVADLQVAQQLLDAQLEAIAKLQAATEAVNGLFTDNSKTALKVGVDQAAIDAAKAKVDQVADGAEKSALLADIQYAQQFLDAQLEAIAKLQAATEAVNGLFTDNSKTALKVGVDQAAIDAAKAKVDLVADSTEKSALLADLQFAQQLLDAQLEAIAKLQAAIEAVNGLFTDSTKTALKTGVNQAAIDAAKEKVDLVADGAEKSALLADLQFAQQLLDAQLEAIAKLQAAIEAVNGLFTDSTKTALKTGVNQAAIDAAKEKVDLVADGAEKSALVVDLQFAQQLLDAQLEAIAKLQAATEAVNGLFTDSTNTALKAGVDQAAIDAASAKVDLVADGAEKSALLADIQHAQQLLDAQLEAIAKLQAATEAVTGLFTDSSKTALKAGVDQAAIDSASAKVDLVADGEEKSALLADIQHAQQLLDAQLEAIAKLQAATEAVNGLFTDSTKTALKVGVDQAAIDAAKEKIDLVADGEEKSALKEAIEIAQDLLSQILAPPTLTGTAPNVNTVRITFSDDAAWRDKITGVYQNGNSVPIHSSRVNRSTAGMIEINLTGASLTPGTHKFQIKAEGYADAEVTIEVPVPLATPALTGTAPNVNTVRITFSDDAAWRDKITGVYQNGNSVPIHGSRVNRSTAGIIEINLTGASLSPGTHNFLIKAEGYADAEVTIEVPVPLAAPVLTGTAPNVETARFTFSDDAAWRDKITGVYLNGNSLPIHSSRVNRSTAGMIEINLTGASLTSGTHIFLIKAEGYADAVVTIEVPPPLAAPTLTGTAPNVDTVRLTYTDNAAWREKITGVYFYRNDILVFLHPSRVSTSTAGIIVLDFTEISLTPGTHQFLIKAEGYEDATAVIIIVP